MYSLTESQLDKKYGNEKQKKARKRIKPFRAASSFLKLPACHTPEDVLKLNDTFNVKIGGNGLKLLCHF